MNITGKQMTVTHLNGTKDNVPEDMAKNALYDLENCNRVQVGDGKTVPFHAVDIVTIGEERSECDDAPYPTINGDFSPLTVNKGDWFNELAGINAFDWKGNWLLPVVTLKEAK